MTHAVGLISFVFTPEHYCSTHTFKHMGGATDTFNTNTSDMHISDMHIVSQTLSHNNLNVSLKKMWLSAALLLTDLFLCFSSGDKVTQEMQPILKTEGQEVSLECSFDTSSSYADLYWYRQYPGSALQYILYNGNNNHKSEFAKKRFDSTVDKTNGKTVLTISQLVPEDTAVYYCGLEPGRLGLHAPLTFGKGTDLSVEPKGDNKKPKLSLLKGKDKDGKDGPEVCLAAGFFPKDGKMILTKKDGVSEELSTKNEAVLASSKTYYFAGFQKDDGSKIHNCTMDGLTEEESGTKATQETPLVCEPKAEAKNSTVKTIKNIDYPKLNFMSLVVNGLRVLFAKTVTFNMMMTLKALVF